MDGRLPEHISPTAAPGDGWYDDDWAHALGKHLAPAAQALARLTVTTLLGPYRLDLVVQLGALRVGFSCDGGAARPAFHDLWRDTALVGGGLVDVVYRLRPLDLVHHLEDCLYVVCRSDPRLFSLRGRTNLSRLASDAVLACRLPREDLAVYYPAPRDEELDVDPSGDPADVRIEACPRETAGSLHVLRRDRAQVRRGYEYVRRSGARTVEDAMERFAAEHLREPDPDR